jgi:hypothetical protein
MIFRGKTISLTLLLCSTLLLSCNKEEEPLGILSQIIETELPTTGKVGENIEFLISHAVMTSCGFYSNQKTTQNKFEVTVTFYAEYIGLACLHWAPPRQTIYSFKPTKKGEYTFRFNQGSEGFLVQTITID